MEIPGRNLDIAEKCARGVLSLPMFPELSEEEIQYIAETVGGFFQDKGKKRLA